MSIGSRCSEVEKGAARLEQVQRGQKKKNYKDALPPPLWYVSMLVLHLRMDGMGYQKCPSIFFILCVYIDHICNLLYM